jgi:hypothetical protein
VPCQADSQLVCSFHGPPMKRVLLRHGPMGMLRMRKHSIISCHIRNPRLELSLAFDFLFRSGPPVCHSGDLWSCALHPQGDSCKLGRPTLGSGQAPSCRSTGARNPTS